MPKYAPVHYGSWPISPHQRAVYHPEIGSQILTNSEWKILSACHGVHTLDEHSRRLGEAVASDAEALKAIRTSLQGMVRRGLLVPFPETLGAASSSGARAKVSTLCIMTCNRPQALEAALTTYLESMEAFGHGRIRILVSDDSRGAEARKLNRAVIRRLSARYPRRTFRYLDRPAKLRLARELARRAGIDRRIVEFAILGPATPTSTTIGASRNAVLLSTAGESVVSVDDDTEAVFVPLNGDGDRVLRVAEEEGSETWWLTEAEVNRLRAEAKPFDFIAEHEALLGRSPRQVIEEAHSRGMAIDPVLLTPSLLQRLKRKDARVVITRPGNFGDSGIGNPFNYALLPKHSPSFSRLIQSEEGYRSALRDHRVIFGFAQPTLSCGPHAMATHIGLDNREMLPPFVSMGRGEDDVFGRILIATSPGALFSYPAFSCGHFPVESRTLTMRKVRDQFLESFESPLSSLLSQVTNTSRLVPLNLNSAERIRWIGSRLLEFARIPSKDFADSFIGAIHYRATSKAGELSHRLASESALPDFIRSDWEQAISDLETYLERFDTRSRLRAAAQAQELFENFAQVMLAWPNLWEAAAKARRKGDLDDL